MENRSEMTPTRDLVKIKAEQENLMSETVYVQHLMRALDGAGGWTETWQTSDIVKGRIAATTASMGKELLLAGKVTSLMTYVVTLPDDTALTTKDCLQINGEQYQVITVLERSEKTALRVICEKLM